MLHGLRTMGILHFCEHCGNRKIRDVKEELEKLIQTKVISSQQCGICLKLLATDSLSVAKNINPDKSIVSINDMTVELYEHTGNDEHIKNEQQQVDASDVSTNEQQLDCCDVSRKKEQQVDCIEVTTNKQQLDCSDVSRKEEEQLDCSDMSPNKQQLDYIEVSTNEQQLDCSDVSDKSFKSVERRTRLSTGTIKLEPIQGLDSEDGNDSVDIPFDSIIENTSADEKKCNNSGVKSLKKRKNASSGVKKKNVQKTWKSPWKKKAGECDVEPELSERQIMLRRALDPKLLPMIDMEQPPTKNIHVVCKRCKQAFTKMGDFINHISCHTGEELSIAKPYVCPVCTSRFPNFTSLDRHMVTHMQEEDKRYICEWDNCRAKFGCQRYLDKHIRRHQGHKEVNKKHKKYQCSMCDHKTTSKEFLSIHHNTHTNAKPFKCSFCHKCFNDPSSKVRHEGNTHNQEKRYVCELCGYCSYYRQDLIKHQRIHTGVKPFACDQCAYRCNRRDNLKKHLKIHSGREKLTNVPAVI
ncbi:uncharacterized protein [Amphiura filiformis]|uniref:uncharacterized protein n=1 Tax=Amphiura filiformis TaxID=82378 RepID=UPI003B216250